MEKKYKDSLAEVAYVMNRLTREELQKIPFNFRVFVFKNKSRITNKTYKYNADIRDINLSKEAKAILYIISKKWLID